MARTADSTSKRQRAFVIIDEHPNIKRRDCLPILMSTLDISPSYANTLFESWRQKQKDEGLFTPTYFFKDVHNGYIVDPFISTRNIPTHDITKESPTTLKKALAAYKRELAARLVSAKELTDYNYEQESDGT